MYVFKYYLYDIMILLIYHGCWFSSNTIKL